MRTVVIGDSHAAGPPGAALERLLGAAARVGHVGQGARAWLLNRENELEEALRGAKRVVYIFGINDNPGPDTERAFATMRNMAERAGAETWWVGAPSYPGDRDQRRAEDLNRSAKRVFGTRFIDSQSLTTRDPLVRAPDGLHFTRAGGEAWARGIVKRIKGSGTAFVWFAFGLFAAWAVTRRLKW